MDKSNNVREVAGTMPQVDPCCFPLLRPRGTLGWRFNMMKNGITRTALEEVEMQRNLENAFDEDDPVNEIEVDLACLNEGGLQEPRSSDQNQEIDDDDQGEMVKSAFINYLGNF